MDSKIESFFIHNSIELFEQLKQHVAATDTSIQDAMRIIHTLKGNTLYFDDTSSYVNELKRIEDKLFDKFLNDSQKKTFLESSLDHLEECFLVFVGNFQKRIA